MPLSYNTIGVSVVDLTCMIMQKKTLFAETFQKISFLCVAAYVGSMILEKYDFSLSSPVSCYAISLSLFLLFLFVSCLLQLQSLRLFCAHKNQKSGIQIRTIMVENIEKILERGDRIELLVDKTATMQDSAFHFKKQSKRLRQALWMKNAKLL